MTDLHALEECFILFLDILLYILVDIPVFYNNSLKMTQGRKSKGKKRMTEESQALATQDEPWAPEVSEEPEVTEEQSEASQEMPPPRPPPIPPKEGRKEGP